uniref:Uncharacterized protein n=1 Tax=Anguilla anguilla TaxID=7936 RepID=A0A0E9PIZ0_ANGAN
MSRIKLSEALENCPASKNTS